MKNILITGSSGMIGTALTKTLQKQGYSIYGFDIKEPTLYNEFHHKLVDLTKPINEALSNVTIDAVIHLAAHARVYELVLDPAKALENIMMTHNILEWCRKMHIAKFLFASSREVYGDQTILPINETMANQRLSKSVYTAGKISGEAYCHAYNNCYDIECKIMRLSNVYGRYDFSDRFIPKIISRLIHNKEIIIYGENKTLDFTYLDDCINGISILINKWDEAKYSEYNIASGTQSYLTDVANRIKEILNSESVIKLSENLTGEVFNYQADLSRIETLGYAPHTTLDMGLHKSIEYYTDARNKSPMENG